MNKFILSAFLTTLCIGTTLFASDKAHYGIVNFASCITDSKLGQKEQESMENLHKQMSATIEETEKELKELAAKFEDTEFLDSLSPQAEEELKLKFQTRQEDMGRFQNQFYQVLNQVQQQCGQRMKVSIAAASEIVAKDQGLDFVLNQDICFFSRPELDVTKEVITQMDKAFVAAKKTSEGAQNAAAEAGEAEALLNKAP